MLTLRLHILHFPTIKSSIRALCWDSLPLCDKWIYYILHWWSSVGWTTAVINDNMNFADTLYWLQIATTTSQLRLLTSLRTNFLSCFDSHQLTRIFDRVSLIISALQIKVLHLPELGQQEDAVGLLWWTKPVYTRDDLSDKYGRKTEVCCWLLLAATRALTQREADNNYVINNQYPRGTEELHPDVFWLMFHIKD